MKKILPILIAAIMLIAALPCCALAADRAPVDELWIGSTRAIDDGQILISSGDGWKYDAEKNQLFLSGGEFMGAGGTHLGAALYVDAPLITVILEKDTHTVFKGDKDEVRDASTGILCEGNMVIRGMGSLTAEGAAAPFASIGMIVTGDLTIADCRVKMLGGTSITTSETHNYSEGMRCLGELRIYGKAVVDLIGGYTANSTADGIFYSAGLSFPEEENRVCHIYGHALVNIRGGNCENSYAYLPPEANMEVSMAAKLNCR